MDRNLAMLFRGWRCVFDLYIQRSSEYSINVQNANSPKNIKPIRPWVFDNLCLLLGSNLSVERSFSPIF